MKFSLLGLCAIAIMMTFGFTLVQPFVQPADAHPIEIVVMEIVAYTCPQCGAVTDSYVSDTYTEYYNHSPPDADHTGISGTRYIVDYVECTPCDDCEASSS